MSFLLYLLLLDVACLLLLGLGPLAAGWRWRRRRLQVSLSSSNNSCFVWGPFASGLFDTVRRSWTR